MEDDEIRELITRLSRPHPSGGAVIERAAILAEGAHSTDVLKWIAEHDGEPESAASQASSGGLHGARFEARAAETRVPLRYVLPAEALS